MVCVVARYSYETGCYDAARQADWARVARLAAWFGGADQPVNAARLEADRFTEPCFVKAKVVHGGVEQLQQGV